MNDSARRMRSLAKCLISYEARETDLARLGGAAVFAVADKLRTPLAALSGINGFQSLLARALSMAAREVRWLRAVRVQADGSLECPADSPRLSPKEITEGMVALVAQLLGLLVTFIGEALTLSLVLEVWPHAPITDLTYHMTNTTKEDL
jgi:hypothetical protein